MKRLFIGIALPDRVKEVVADAKALLETESHGMKWVPAENIHLTLKFLGDREDVQVDEIKKSLVEAVEGISPFSAVTDIFGVFPNSKRARVLWLGVKESEELRHLFTRVEEALEGEGTEAVGAFGKRDFCPHITFGRYKFPKPIDIDGLNSKINADSELLVDEVVLYSSRLSARGAEYAKEARIRLISPRA